MLDTQIASTPRVQGAAVAPENRRTRLRLRDLCDEVLASYRLASDRDLFTAADRVAARDLMLNVVKR